MSLSGYLERDSAHPGDDLTAYVSCSAPEYRADLVRLITPEVGESSRPYHDEPVGCPGTGIYPGTIQPLRPGSFAYVDASLPETSALTIVLGLRSTVETATSQTLLAIGWASGDTCLKVALDEERHLSVEALRGGDPVATLRSNLQVPLRRWLGVAVSVSPLTGEIALAIVPRGRQGLEPALWDHAVGTFPALTGWALPLGPTSIAAQAVSRRGTAADACEHFTGRIESPLLGAGARVRSELEALAGGGAAPDATVVASWDFSLEMPGAQIVDTSGGGRHGVLVNLPARAVRGSAWAGEVLDVRLDPTQYGAIHFHADDIADAAWEPSLTLRLPASLASGVYGLKLSAAGRVDWVVPFAVRPSSRAARRDVVFLLPTCTYAAYANMRLRATSRVNEPMHARLTVLDDTDLLLLETPALGNSTYDSHLDGSHVMYSSLRRPVTNFRPTGRIYKFCEDLLLVDWLTHEGIEFDVITDEDLHLEGPSALEGHRVLMTSSHPEYCSRRMLDGLETFVRGGGRLMYLGGNGFYQAAEFCDDLPGTVEVRRPGQDGLFPTDNAETNFSFTGKPGGLWSKLGRGPEQLTGVGYVSQGFDVCTGYLRNEGLSDERLGFVLDGVDEELIGAFGILRGGAAGYEIDRMSLQHGTPAQTVRLASSQGHSNVYDIMISAIVDRFPRDADALDPVRADMVFIEAPGGGAVFSVGSIAWFGSLSENGFENTISRVTRNVLERFLDPTAF